MSAHMGSIPWLLNGLVSVALENMADRTVVKILPAVTSKDSLARYPARDPEAMGRMFDRCLRVEEAFSTARFCDTANGMIIPGTTDAPTPPSPASTAGMWLLWVREDFQYYRNGMQHMRELAQQPYYKVLPEWKRILDDARSPSGPRHGILSANALGALASTMHTLAETQAMQASTAVGLAATRYRLAHNNQYPDSAQALVPEFLDAVPLDPFDGQPIRYKKAGETLTIYSIGSDLTDNGGQVVQSKNGPAPDTGFILKPPTQ
jgi:hypothetical protein